MKRLATLQADAVRAQRDVLAAEEKLLADVSVIAHRVRRHRVAIACTSGFASGLLAGFVPGGAWARVGRFAFAATRMFGARVLREVTQAMGKLGHS